MIIACLHCNAAIRVLGDGEETHTLLGPGSDFWPNKFVCYRCGEPAEGFLEPEVAAEAILSMELVDLTAEEAFAAINGLGIPEERNCCAEVLQELLGAHGIKAIGRQAHGALRFYVDCLELNDGTRIHFGPSAKGAAVYRITKPISYTEKVLSDEAG